MRNSTTRTHFWPAAILTVISAGAAYGDTVLLFERSNGFRLVSSSIPDYGDRVTATVQNGFRYGGEANTPNVVASYRDQTSAWSTSYGDLINVIYTSAADGILEATLTADPGYRVALHSFDLAGWNRTDYTINSVAVLNEANQPLYFQSNVLVQGDANGPQHTTFNFVDLVAPAITIRFDAANIMTGFGAQNIGLDNVRFSQVPEPSAGLIALLGATLSLGARARARRRRRPPA
ncbi:MAG: hypothetical protein DWQ35_01090 [Planctomycetota bacterium]|nr:MAG: hypothetical protein DWQ35_01090 [Planctomycetota bacterium]